MLIALMIFSVGSVSVSYAESNAEKQQKLNNINEDKKEVKSDLQELYGDIKNQQKQIDKVKASMNEKQSQINNTTADISRTEKEIEKSQEGLDARLRVMYKNGSVGYLDVLFGSSSISEFLSNIEMIERIYKNDQNTIATLENQQQELEVKRGKLKKEQESLAADKKDAEEKKAALTKDKKKLESKLDELNAEAARIGKEMAAKQDKKKVYGGGPLAWPVSSRKINSYFGYRIHPIFGYKKLHTGLDIGGVGVGSPVYAAADGKVISAGWNNSYGYLVVIDHGSGLSTYYAHNSSLAVSTGQNVTKGSLIAYTGSTGNSTGPHLHFEVRVNGSYRDPLNYL